MTRKWAIKQTWTFIKRTAIMIVMIMSRIAMMTAKVTRM